MLKTAMTMIFLGLIRYKTSTQITIILIGNSLFQINSNLLTMASNNSCNLNNNSKQWTNLTTISIQMLFKPNKKQQVALLKQLKLSSLQNQIFKLTIIKGRKKKNLILQTNLVLKSTCSSNNKICSNKFSNLWVQVEHNGDLHSIITNSIYAKILIVLLMLLRIPLQQMLFKQKLHQVK